MRKVEMTFKNIFIFIFIFTSVVNAAFDGNYVFKLESATQTQINAITSPQSGMMIYNSDDNKTYYYSGTAWFATSNSNIYNSNGQLSGNREMDLNAYNLGFMNGNVGIGDATPDATLDVNGSFSLDGAFYDKDGDAGTVGQILTSTATGTDWIGTASIPYIGNPVTHMLPSSTYTYTLRGYNFLSTSIVTIPGFDGTINSSNVLSPTQIEITVTSGAATADYDIVVTNNGVSNTAWIGNGNSLLNVAPEVAYLYAITSSSQCAEALPYGPNHITEASNAYFSTEHKDIIHTRMRQVFTVGGVELFRITYNFTTAKTLQERFDSATTVGEDVNWVVEQGASTFNYGPHKWWYSNAADVGGKWIGSGTRWARDDGSWGAAPNDVQGNQGPYEIWGHGNRNSTDTNWCGRYHTNGVQNSSTSIRSYMYLLIP